MKSTKLRDIFNPGDKKHFKKLVQESDVARFESGSVHPVYATFAIARDAEWTCRLFVLEMKENHEEGIGTMVSVVHHSPAHIGQQVEFIAELVQIKGLEIHCRFEAYVEHRLIARGEQVQKVLPREKLESVFNRVKSDATGTGDSK